MLVVVVSTFYKFFPLHSLQNIFLTFLSDGVLNIQIALILAKGTGRIHGVDSSVAMIETARKEAEKAGVSKICTFEGRS